MNDDNYYKEQLNQLSVKVDELTAYKQKNFDIYNKINPTYIYISVPILTFLILFVTKPDIIMVKVKDGNTFFTDTKISYLKLFVSVMVVILIEVIIYFLLNINKKKI